MIERKIAFQFFEKANRICDLSTHLLERCGRTGRYRRRGNLLDNLAGPALVENGAGRPFAGSGHAQAFEDRVF